jgi:hypothetical protein
MAILERQIKHIHPEKRAERAAHAGEFEAIESKYGYPPNKHYILIAGSDEWGTDVLEREWPSMAVMEETFQKVNADPEYQALMKKYTTWARDTRLEIYMVATK